MSTKTFVSVGDRATVYQKPYTQQGREGTGVVREVHDPSDMESAYVGIEFDDEPDSIFDRWLLLAHLEGTGK